MRSYCLIGLMVIGLLGVGTATASAHPREISFHAGVCQYVGVALGTGTGSLSYSSAGIMALTGGATSINVVCPLDYVFFDSDTLSGPFWVVAWITVSTPSGASSPSSCSVLIDQPSPGAVLVNNSWPAAGTSGTAWGSAHVFVPTVTVAGQTPPTPAGVRVWCTLVNGQSIGAIRVNVGDN
jgi:hypothetical protein